MRERMASVGIKPRYQSHSFPIGQEMESRTALPGISTVKTSSPVFPQPRLYDSPSPTSFALGRQNTMGGSNDRQPSPHLPPSLPKKRNFSDDSAVNFNDDPYPTPQSTYQLPSIQNLLREVAPAAPPTPASSAPSAVPSPSDPLRNQRSAYDQPAEQVFERRRRIEERNPGIPRLDTQYHDPRRSSGASEYDKRHLTAYDSPQTMASQSPPVGVPSLPTTHASTYLPGQIPLRPTLQPVPRLPPLPNQHQLPQFGPRLHAHDQAQRWGMEGPEPSSNQYGYQRDRPMEQYDALPQWTSPDRYVAYASRPYDGHYGAGQITFQPVGIHGDGQLPRKRRGNLPKEATAILKAWYQDHIDSPYPTEDDKTMLCRQAHLSINQVSNWFINARRRAPGRDGRGSQSSKGSPPATTRRPA